MPPPGPPGPPGPPRPPGPPPGPPGPPGPPRAKPPPKFGGGNTPSNPARNLVSSIAPLLSLSQSEDHFPKTETISSRVSEPSLSASSALNNGAANIIGPRR